MVETRTGIRVAQPFYLLLAEKLAESIERGTYPVGSKLPTEAELCEKFNASRFTVREAVKQLQALGLVVTRQGTGTEVLARRATSGRFVLSFNSVNEFLHSARETKLFDVTVEDITAERDIAAIMRCKPRQRLLYIRARRVVLTPKGRTGRTVALVSSYVPAAYDGIRSDLSHLETSISAVIEKQYGVSTARIEQTIEPCAVVAKEASLLGVQTGSLGLRFGRQYISTRGEVFQYVTSIQAGNEAHISMSIRNRDIR